MRKTDPRVLVFGVEPALAALTSDILTEDGYKVAIATSRPAALNLAKSVNPDVILVDLALSVCSCGWNLLAELRSNSDTSGIPLLAISDTPTALDDAVDRFGVRHGVIKPYEIDDLERAIAAAIGGVQLLPDPPSPPTTGDLWNLAADTLARESHTVTIEWLRCVQWDGASVLAETIPVRLLMNSVATWQDGVISALRYGPEEVSSREKIRDKLRCQIHEARHRGVTPSQTKTLFEILRDEVWLALDRSELSCFTAMDVSEVHHALSVSLEAVRVQIAAGATMTSTHNR